MKHNAPPLSDMPGMWRRALIIHADGRRDATTQVRWLQAQRLFVDLRQGAALPDFLHLRCLNDLTLADCALLARQEGFAGRLGFDGDCFEWLRLIDFQPPSALPDAGRLWWEEQTLIEEGRDVPYFEHWLRDPTVVSRPLAALRLGDPETGVTALVVQLGTVFMFARDRAVAITAGTSLVDCVAGADSLVRARAMLDCEITLGSAGSGPNVILASTHPWRVAERFELICDDRAAETLDTDPAGKALRRQWEVLETEGDPGAVWPQTPGRG
jgi:hypothetical protein